jgi:hypothetical protein
MVGSVEIPKYSHLNIYIPNIITARVLGLPTFLRKIIRNIIFKRLYFRMLKITNLAVVRNVEVMYDNLQ